MRTASSSRPWRGHVDAYLLFMSCCVDGFCGQALSHHIVLFMRGSVDAYRLFISACLDARRHHLVLSRGVLWMRPASSSRLWRGFVVSWMRIA